VILAKHLHRLIRWRFAMAIELGETSVACCHYVILQYGACACLRFAPLSGHPLPLSGPLIKTSTRE
jgi:hypothetical protein